MSTDQKMPLKKGAESLELSSTALFARAQKIAPGGVHSPVRSFKGMDRAPLFFKWAQGAYLESVEGQRYIDFCQSFGPLILGHRDPEVEEGVLEMIHTAWTFGACDLYSLELAEWLCAEIPWLEKVRFVSSGTEAVMSALRVARAATDRELILKFEGCYHGHADSLLVHAGSGLAGVSASSSAGVSNSMAAQTLVCPLDDEISLEKIMSEKGSKIAAVIIEPLPANYGLLIQRKQFLLKISGLCKKHGCILIFDEVISGFRVGLQGMAGILGIQPDLVTYGKIIGGGFPVGCYGGRRELMDLVAPLGPVYQAGTLSANPVGMRAGLLTLKKMKRINGYETLEKRSQDFVGKVQENFNSLEIPLQMDRYASLFWLRKKNSNTEPLRCLQQIAPEQALFFKQVFLNCLDLGIYLAPNAYEVGFLSLAHDEEILQKSADSIKLATERIDRNSWQKENSF